MKRVKIKQTYDFRNKTHKYFVFLLKFNIVAA